MYRYFVSYNSKERCGNIGTGNTVVRLSFKLDSAEHIDMLERQVTEEGNHTNTVIINFILL